MEEVGMVGIRYTNRNNYSKQYKNDSNISYYLAQGNFQNTIAKFLHYRCLADLNLDH